MTEKAKKPSIRFKGFTDAWEQRKFEEMADRASTVSSAVGLPRVEYEDIISGIGQLNKDVFVKGSLKSGIEFNAGDILYGKLRPYLQNWLLATFSGLAVGDFWVLRPLDVDSGFLYRLIQTRQFDEIVNQSIGTKMPRADWKLVSKSVFAVPVSIEEQARIGRCLSSLDNLITLHQRKYDKLVNIKKSLLEKMFPSGDEEVPKIRFKGFTEAWEQRKLGDIGKTFTGLSGKTSDDFGHGEGRFVTYMNVFSNAIANPAMVEPIEIDTKQSSVKYGDVFFTTSSETPDEVGMSSIWLENTQNTYLNSFCFGYRPQAEIDSVYLAYSLRSASFRKKVILLAQGISRYNISKNKVMELELLLPSLAEQHQIGAYFLNLDNLITLHQRKLEKLKNIKKSLLEKMFV